MMHQFDTNYGYLYFSKNEDTQYNHHNQGSYKHKRNQGVHSSDPSFFWSISGTSINFVIIKVNNIDAIQV